MTAFTTDLYLDGAWVRGGAGTFTTLNPATGEPLAEVASAGRADVDRAVAAATRALRGDWAETPPSRKGALIHRLADLAERDADRLAWLESLEMGAPAGIAQGLFVPNLIASLRYYAGWADKINGDQLSTDGYFGRATHSYTRREPVGVIAAIIPWNSPLMILGWKLAPALAAGNTVVVKPAEDAPLAILHLAKLVAEAGFPPGVVQRAAGHRERDRGSPGPPTPASHKVSFTGSPETGRRILRNAAGSFKRIDPRTGRQVPADRLRRRRPRRGRPGRRRAASSPTRARSAPRAAGSSSSARCSTTSSTRLARPAVAQVLGDPFDPATTMGR